MKKMNNKKGFTLVELMLAVAFLGTLLLSIAMLTIQLINIYTKGSTMRSINTTASSIIKDLRSSVGYSENIPDILDAKDSRENFFWRNDAKASESTYGMFCTGTYTYVWNYRDAMLNYREDKTNGDYFKIGIGTDESKATGYALAKVYDSKCNSFNKVVKDAKTTPGSSPIIMVGKTENLTVLVDGRKGSEGTDLALYDFSVLTATRSQVTGRAIYDISFVLGTMQGNINVTSSNDYCNNNTPGEYKSTLASQYDDVSMDYCSVNRFEVVVRQTGINID